MRETNRNRKRFGTGFVVLAAIVLLLPACAKHDFGGAPDSSDSGGADAPATPDEEYSYAASDDGADGDATASPAPDVVRAESRPAAKVESWSSSGPAKSSAGDGAPRSEPAASTPDYEVSRATEGCEELPHAEMTEAKRPLTETRSAERHDEPVRLRQERIRAGTLTAGSFDDHENLAEFRQFVSAALQGDGHEVLPRLAIGQRVLIHVRNGQDQPVADARVQVRAVSDSHHRRADDLVDLHTGSDGRTLFLTGRDGGTTERYLVTVTPPDGGAAVEQEFDAGQLPWLVVLPETDAELPARLDLALVVDTTGSMSDELEYLKIEIDDIAATVRRMFPNVDARFALAVYRDEGDAYVTRSYDFTPSVSDFRRTLSQQRAGGGGDYPEAMHEALERASHFSWRDRDTARVLFLVGDAPPHDRFAEQTFAAVDDLRQQGVHIYPVAGSGVKEKAEFVLRSAAFLTLGEYLFLTDHSGVGRAHAAPHASQYSVEHLNRLMLRMIASELAGRRLAAQQVIAIERGDLDPVDIEPEPIEVQTAEFVPILRNKTDRAVTWLTADWIQWPPAWLILLASLFALGLLELIVRRSRRRVADGAGG